MYVCIYMCIYIYIYIIDLFIFMLMHGGRPHPLLIRSTPRFESLDGPRTSSSSRVEGSDAITRVRCGKTPWFPQRTTGLGVLWLGKDPGPRGVSAAPGHLGT